MQLHTLPPTLMAINVQSLVGATAAAAFMKFMDKEYNKPITAKEILETYKKVKAKLEKQTSDQNWVTMRDLVSVLATSTVKYGSKEFDNLKDYLVDTKAEGKVHVITHLPEALLTSLAQTELVDEIAGIIQEVNRQRQADAAKATKGSSKDPK